MLIDTERTKEELLNTGFSEKQAAGIVNVFRKAYTEYESGLATKEDLIPIHGDLNAVRKDLNAVRKDVDALRKDVDVLKVEVDALRKDVDVLKMEVGALRKDLDTLKVEVGALRKDIDTLKVELSSFRREVMQAMGTLEADLKRAMNARFLGAMGVMTGILWGLLELYLG